MHLWMSNYSCSWVTVLSRHRCGCSLFRHLSQQKLQGSHSLSPQRPFRVVSRHHDYALSGKLVSVTFPWLSKLYPLWSYAHMAKYPAVTQSKSPSQHCNSFDDTSAAQTCFSAQFLDNETIRGRKMHSCYALR